MCACAAEKKRPQLRYKQSTPNNFGAPFHTLQTGKHIKKVMRQVERMDLRNSVILDLRNALFCMLPFLEKIILAAALPRSVRKWCDRENQFMYAIFGMEHIFISLW